ncbi:hypothetical protein NDA16_001951 [Ustilago loliicola]|nr:hypothetical protein NDA16_001951 [Ustilago loliicola]
MSLPSDAEIVKKVHSIIVNAFEDDAISEHSKRKVREMLNEHFGVDLEPKKKFLNQTIQDQVNKISADREKAKSQPKASTSRSPSPKKSSPAKSQSAKSAKPAKPTKKAPAKRKKLSSDEEEVKDDDDDEQDGEKDYNDSGAAASTSDLSNSSEPEEAEEAAEDAFSELEEDTSVSRSRKKAKPSKSKPSSSTTSKSKPPRTSSAAGSGSSEAEQRLARLKKLVLECGVRKQWKKLYEAADVSETDFAGQCKVVQDVLKELGMTGTHSHLVLKNLVIVRP